MHLNHDIFLLKTPLRRHSQWKGYAENAKKEQEAELSDSSNILENLAEDGEDEGHQDIGDHRDLGYSVRDSGPYENVIGRDRSRDLNTELSLDETGFCDKQGLQSLRRILTNGQTTNV